MLDLAVLGAGMAGLSAAAAASRHGLKVSVFEKSNTVGGASLLSKGNFWTAASLDQLQDEDPTAASGLGGDVVREFDSAVSWLRTMGQECSRPTRSLRFGRGYEIDIPRYFDACRAEVIRTGGTVIVDSPVVDLIIGEGTVGGVEVAMGSKRRDFKSRWTLLAGGGFQANKSLLRKHLGIRSDQLLLRSIDIANGDGLRLAIKAGAALSVGMDRFYGHLICLPSAAFRQEHFFDLAQFGSEVGVLLNMEGVRFTDESRGDHHNAEAVLRQRGGLAALLFDEVGRKAAQPPASLVADVDKVEAARAAGGRVVVAHSIQELAGKVAAWGYPRNQILVSVSDYNECLEGTREPAIARSEKRFPVKQAPLYALEVRPAISFTKGGVRVDSEARATDSTGMPIPGLLVAGNDAGGVFVDGYAGGLAAALIFGLKAARAAADPNTVAN